MNLGFLFKKNKDRKGIDSEQSKKHAKNCKSRGAFQGVDFDNLTYEVL